MSFFSILFPLLGLLFLYYVGMIVYDTYIDKLKQVSKTGNIEDEIDISSELEGFSPIEINRKDEKNSKSNNFCSGLQIEKLRDIMESVAYGKSFDGLDNLSYKCLSTE